MATDRHYSRTLELKLRPFVDEAGTDGLLRLLDSLSRSEQRTAGYMLGERLLLDCPTDVYWQLTEALVHHDSKAYLITLMKTFLVRLSRSTASLSDSAFCRLASCFNEVERQKVGLLLLPSMMEPRQVEELFQAMCVARGREQMVYLVRVDTLPCLFLLLRSLRYIESDKAEVMLVARQLMKRGTGSSFNVASIIKVAFGLDELQGTFSLRLQPYEIARLEQSYEAFLQSVG